MLHTLVSRKAGQWLSRPDCPVRQIIEHIRKRGELRDAQIEAIGTFDCTSAKGAWHSDAEIKIDKKGFVTRDGKKTKDFWNAKISSSKKPLRLKVRNIAGDESILPL